MGLFSGCTPPPQEQLVVRETSLEGVSGVALPGGRFLWMKTVERDELRLPPSGVPEAAILLYLGVTAGGSDGERPREVLGHRKLAASAQLLVEEPLSGGSLPLLPDLFRYDYNACQGLLRNARERLFAGASSDASGRVVALRFADAGAKEAREEWGLFYPENGALTDLPRPGQQAQSLVPPLWAASNLSPPADRRVAVKLSPDGRFAAALTKSSDLEISALDGFPTSMPPVKAWEFAWHPRLGLLYITSPKGLESLSPIAGERILLLEKLPSGEKPLALDPSPDGRFLLATAAGGGETLWRLALDTSGAVVSAAVPMPEEASSWNQRVWAPGTESELWCFHPLGGPLWKVDVARCRAVASWKWDRSLAELHLSQSGPTLPTLTLRYTRPGAPKWHTFTAWYDAEAKRFRGLSEPAPVDMISWTPLPLPKERTYGKDRRFSLARLRPRRPGGGLHDGRDFGQGHR